MKCKPIVNAIGGGSTNVAERVRLLSAAVRSPHFGGWSWEWCVPYVNKEKLSFVNVKKIMSSESTKVQVEYINEEKSTKVISVKWKCTVFIVQ